MSDARNSLRCGDATTYGGRASSAPGIHSSRVNLAGVNGVGYYCEDADYGVVGPGANTPTSWVTPEIFWTDSKGPFMGEFEAVFDAPPGNTSFRLPTSVWTSLRAYWSNRVSS
jgi:hypothetical protein